MHIAVALWAVAASWMAWSWDRFYKYHATILYMAAMSLLYLFFTTHYPLWKMQPDLGLPYPIVEMLYTFIVFPCTVILFLSHYPDSVKNQILHNIKWITIYFAAEWVGSLLNRIMYDNGWSLWWSLLFLIIMFPMLRLHYKRPLLAYIVTFIVITLILYFFEIPWASSTEVY